MILGRPCRLRRQLRWLKTSLITARVRPRGCQLVVGLTRPLQAAQ